MKRISWHRVTIAIAIIAAAASLGACRSGNATPTESSNAGSSGAAPHSESANKSSSSAAGTAGAKSGTTSPATGEVVEYQADYPIYDSADHLFGKANLVVRATVSPRPLRTQKLMPDTGSADPKLNPSAGAPGAQPPDESDPVVITVYRATITKVHKGQAKAGQSVEIQQLGGVLGGITYREKHARPLAGGKNYLLFLQTFPDAPAALLNPLQGQYPLDRAGTPAPLSGNPIKVTNGDLKRLGRTN
jgi:hypothetical protein